ncbi:MAG: phosphoglucosamine mutase [Flavobacteriales bacterium]
MTLIKSISGIRGTIGGKEGDNLTPLDVVRFSAAFYTLVSRKLKKSNVKMVIGRDARVSGPMIQALVANTLVGMGAEVVDLGLSTTPTVEVAVEAEQADAGIILTASHNPGQWNALKLLNAKGEFISADWGKELLAIGEASDFEFAPFDQLGSVHSKDYMAYHIEKIMALPLVNAEAIAKANFKVVVDGVHSSGGVYVPALLKALGVKDIQVLYAEPTGIFPHNPEPLAEHLGEISKVMKSSGAEIGIVVDPDVDRLAFVCEDGSMFGEEYTLVAVADYVLKHQKGNTVSNLSSTRALRDVTEKHGYTYSAAAVGEVNVVEKMKETQAVIGGEGNGGIIYPELHYGRDALVGIALFLSHMAELGKPKLSALRDGYPYYAMSKQKIELQAGLDVDGILKKMEDRYANEPHSTIDGLKIDFPSSWVHLRKSNTEPIIRIYSESGSKQDADALADRFVREIQELV